MTSSRHMIWGIVAVSLTVLFTPGTSPADDLPVFEFNIERQPLATALLEYAEITDRQLLFNERIVRGVESNPVWGVMSRNEALSRLLEGTNRSFSVTPSGVAVIQRGPRNLPAPTPLEDEPFEPPVKTVQEEVVVTGSRLTLEASQVSKQVVVLRHPDLVATGKPSLGRALATLPQNYGALLDTVTYAHTSADNGPANGASNIGAAATVNLRGFSGSGTLVLVNGRRLGLSGIQGGVQDISAFPISFVERVEIILDGASSIYGADAVGGVVNIITKKRAEELVAGVRYGAPFEHGGSEVGFDLTGGRNWESGNVVLGLSTYNQASLNRADLGARDGNSSGEYFNSRTGTLSPNSPFLSPGVAFFNDDETYWQQSDPGNPNPTLGDLAAFTRLGSAAINPEDVAPEIESVSANMYLAQAISDRTNLTARFGYTAKDVARDGGYNKVITALEGDSPWNPTRGNQAGGTAPAEQRISVRGYYPALGVVSSRAETDSWSIDLGLDTRLSERWDLQLGATYSSSDYGYLGRGWLDLFGAQSGGMFNPWGDGTASLQNAVSWEQPDGSTVEGTVLDFMTRKGDSTAWSTNENSLLDVRLRGHLFELPAGVAKAIFGVEYRNYKLRGDSYRAGSQIENAGTDQGAMDAGQDVAATYTEWFLPLLDSRSNAGELGLQAAYRAERYGTTGYFEEARNDQDPNLPLDRFDAADGHRFEADTWMAGLVWTPVDALRIKLNYNTSFVAPGLVQLFQPVIEIDPSQYCGVLATAQDGLYSTLNGYDPNAPYPENPLAGCFIPSYSFDDAFSANPAAFQARPVTQFRGGNPNLDPQRGTSRSLAAEWFLSDDLGARLVWWNTVYRDKFVDPYQDYFRRPAAGSDLINTFPQLFTFHPDGQVATIRSQTVNLDRQEIEGVDLVLDYTPTTSFGEFAAHLNWTFFTRNRARLDGNGELAIREGIGIETPRHSGLLRLSWTRGDWAVYMHNYYRAATYSFDYFLDGKSGLQHEAYWRSNLMAQYHLGARGDWLDNLAVRFGINNLADGQQRSRYVFEGETVAVASTGFNGIYTDPRRRSFFIALSKAFF